MQPKAVTDILRKSKNDLPHLFFVFKVGNTGNAVTDRFDRGNEILMHHPGMVSAIGISPQRKSVHAKKPLQKHRVTSGNISDRADTIPRKFRRGGWAAVNHIAAWEWPHFFSESVA